MSLSVKAIEAIYHLRKTKSKRLVRFQGNIWSSPEAPRGERDRGNYFVPSWYIKPQSVEALSALGFLLPEPEVNGIPSYRLTSKGERGRVKI